ncbi:MAG: ParB/RepB/Spo0J family partition protein [Phycisphaerae bacterium]
MAKDGKTQRKARLGRGLSSLISSSQPPEEARDSGEFVSTTTPAAKQPVAAEPDGRPREIPVGRISPNPHQPRRDFAEAELAELRESILQQGILQPLIVSHASGSDGNATYTLIAGERRLRAAKSAGLETVPCILKEATHQQMAEWALIENLQRTDLNPMERAEGYQHYINRFHLTTSDAAERLGQPRSTIANHLRLLELCDDAQQLINQGLLTFGHAKVLAGVVDANQQRALARKAVADHLSVRELENLLNAELGEDELPKPTSNARPLKPAYIRDLEEGLTQVIGTKVNIKPGRAKHTGRIVVEYYSLDDFDRIAESLGYRPQ